MTDTAAESLSATSDESPDVPIELREAVIRAWGLEYLGNSHKIMLEAIDSLHKLPTNSDCAKILPVVQSSGMGKSRTMDKIATERIVLPLCLREYIGRSYFAYPLADRVVCNHLSCAPCTTDVYKCKVYLRAFLSSLFATAHLQAESLLPPSEKVPYAYLAKAFYDFFASPSQRNGFYERVVADARKGPSANVWDTFKNFENSLKRRCSNWPSTVCPLVISIDEVHVLYNRRMDIGSDCTLYSLFMSVLNKGFKHNFVTVTLSTERRTASLRALSLKERPDERILAPELTELPFDVYVIADPLICDRETLASVGLLNFTAKFGRPLFYSTYLSRKGHYDDNIVSDMLWNVREKLCGRSWPPNAPLTKLDATSIAVLSARLLLDLSHASADAIPYEEELVRNHLRLFFSAPESGEIVTGSSFEPLIAEASAQMMNLSLDVHWNQEPSQYMNLWHLVGQFVDQGLAANATIGDLIGRALSISAMDCAIRGLQRSGSPRVCELMYQTPVTVAEYYKALLTDEAWEILRQSTPANPAQLSEDSATKTFEEAFQDAYFHFSYYGKAGDWSPMKDTLSWALWLRGSAIVCSFGQQIINRMFPIYFSALGNLSPKAMSVNLEQDRIGQSTTPDNTDILSAEALSIFSPGKRLPYIAVVHCYALTENQGIVIKQPSSPDLEDDDQLTDEDLEVAPRY